ncbi:MAG: hydrogenase nickel incorporation protein HypB [Cyclobacteriaceae bacterium]|nr:hydrogenase nickel incorporation protein HypB [Cyclobacteriaceae bacterium]
MCSTCGCGQPDDMVKISVPGVKENENHHDHEHTHDHHHDTHHHHDHPAESREVKLQQDILYQNNLLAERNRGFFMAKNITAINLVSSPGSGKTTLLEKTIQMLASSVPLSVIEGDQQTSNDADRIAATGAKVVQINTGKGCHLDAHMILHAIEKLKPQQNSMLFIENVGNLVCPSMFDLGEKWRVVIMSVTEGDDKPIKYPDMFHTSQICIINKIDLLPYVDFNLEKAKDYARRVNPGIIFLEVSATRGNGMEEWTGWIRNQMKEPENSVIFHRKVV